MSPFGRSESKPIAQNMCDSCEIRQFSDPFEQVQFQTAVAYLRKLKPLKRQEYADEETGAEQFAAEYHGGMFIPEEAQIIIGCWQNKDCNSLHNCFGRNIDQRSSQRRIEQPQQSNRR